MPPPPRVDSRDVQTELSPNLSDDQEFTPMLSSVSRFPNSQQVPASTSSSFSEQPSSEWKPATLKPPFLIFFAILTSVSIIGLELLLRKSQRDGAVTFLSSWNGNIYIAWLFDHGPVFFAVVFGLIYASIDHEVKRLEPYYQLSKPNGATAENSLLLGYPYEIAFFAPFLALKKKHLVVACSATIMVLTIVGVTPLMNTILSKKEVERSVPFQARSASLLPLDQQDKNLTTAFGYLAYSHQYLNGTLPVFTTSDYAVLPFQPDENSPIFANELWETTTTVYDAHLKCTPGNVKLVGGNINDTYNQTIISNSENDCSFALGIYQDFEKYYPYRSMFLNKVNLDAHERDGLQRHKYGINGTGCIQMDSNMIKEPDCSRQPDINYNIRCPGNDDVLIGFFGRTTNTELGLEPGKWVSHSKASATFCYPVHEKQQAKVRVDAKTKQIISVERIGVKTPFEQFNASYWGDLLVGNEHSASKPSFNISRRPNWGLPDHMSQFVRNPAFRKNMEFYTQPGENPADQFYESLPDTFDRTSPINVFQNSQTTMSSFVLGRQTDLDLLLDPEYLGEIYSEVYRNLFSFGFSSELVRLDNSDSLEASGATRIFKEQGWVMDPVWLRALQAVFGIILILHSILTWRLWSRKCALRGDPGSLAAIMAAAHFDTSVLQDFNDSEFMSHKELTASLKNIGHHYQLKDQVIVVVDAPSHEKDQIPINQCGKRSGVSLSKPWVLGRVAALIVVTVLVAWIVAFCVLYIKNRKLGGFQVPSEDFVYDLYASYLPTISATLLEACIVLLATHVMVLYPFVQLKRGQATAARSLSVNHDQKPAHLQTLNAYKHRNYLLFSLTLTIFLIKVLAITLGGFFYQEMVEHQSEGQVTVMGSATSASFTSFNSTPMLGTDGVTDSEFFYAGVGERFGVNPRPWTTDDLYYIPFSDPTDNKVSETRGNYTLETWGIGVDITCEPIPAEAMEEFTGVTINSTYIYGKSAATVTFSYVAFKEKNNISISVPLYKDSDSHLWRIPIKQTSGLFNKPFYNSSNGWFFENAPEIYPPELARGDVDFFASWAHYKPENLTVVIKDNYGLPENQGQTFTAPGTHLYRHNPIQCHPVPRIVKSQIHSDSNGNIIHTNNIEVPVVERSKENGLGGILYAFHQMVLRACMKTGIQMINAADNHREREDPLPSNWFTFLLNRDGVNINPNFDFYTYSEETPRLMERLYKRLFAIYLQLHHDQIFSSNDQIVTPSTYIIKEMRILVSPAAFCISITILSIAILMVIWAYITLFSGVLPHSPTSLAGTYAAFYASSVIQDVSGTETLRSRERDTRLKQLGNLYGWGKFIGKDGLEHYGIEYQSGLVQKIPC